MAKLKPVIAESQHEARQQIHKVKEGRMKERIGGKRRKL
jgi:hypothetical protein